MAKLGSRQLRCNVNGCGYSRKNCKCTPKETAVNTDTLRTELTTDNTKPRTAAQLLATVKALLVNRKFTGDSPSIRRRQHTEETIVLAVAQVLLDAGFLLGVNDGEEVTVKWSRDIKAIQKALFTTDEDYLFVYVDADQDDPLNVERDERPDYWVRCVYGNDGWDVISDYSSAADLDPYIGDGTAIAELQVLAEEGRI